MGTSGRGRAILPLATYLAIPQGGNPVQGIRLQRFLARRGLGSRRSCEELIRQGRVTVNGAVAGLGASVGPADEVIVDGKPVGPPPPPVYLMLHKPRGVLVTRRDTHGRPTVMALVPARLRESVFPVGRLDMDSEGLLLLTNDGDLAGQVLHPRYGLHRTYLAWVAGEAHAGVPAGLPAALKAGTVLDDGMAAAHDARWTKRWPRGGLLQLTLAEGRKREVRRICAAHGLKVIRLKRIAFGPLRLGNLLPGQTRSLTRSEVAALRAALPTDTGWQKPGTPPPPPASPPRNGHNSS